MYWTTLSKNLQKVKQIFWSQVRSRSGTSIHPRPGSYLVRKSLTCRIRIHNVVYCIIHPIKKANLLMMPVPSNVMMQRNRMCRNLENKKIFRAVNPVLALGKNAGSGSSCPSEKAGSGCLCGSGSMVLRAENLKNVQLKFFSYIFVITNCY
jgi:hypothetical protein